MNGISEIFKARDKPADRTSGSPYSFFWGNSTAGKRVNKRTAMQMTAVYSCVRILSEAVAILPLQFYRYTEDGGKEKALEHPWTIKDPSRVRESWQSTFGGSGNANKVAVLEEGMKYTPISISPEQAQFLETRKFQLDEIARIFRVPPHMNGNLEKSSFNNIEQQSLEFVKYTLDPWVSRWEQSMMKPLLTAEEKKRYFMKFNVDGLLRGDYQSRMNGYAVGIQNGFMSPNDVRQLENMDLISDEEGGNRYMVNGNMVALKYVGAAYQGGGLGTEGS